VDLLNSVAATPIFLTAYSLQQGICELWQNYTERLSGKYTVSKLSFVLSVAAKSKDHILQ